MFNFYVDEDREFAHESTVTLFKEIVASKYEAFTSTYVTDELEKAQETKRNIMISLIAEFCIAVLAPSDGGG